MNKKIIVIGIIFIIFFIAVFSIMYNNKGRDRDFNTNNTVSNIVENRVEDNTISSDIISSNVKGINTVLSLEDEIKEDSIWCGTFQLIWNDLKNDLAKQYIVFVLQLKVAENLNKETFTIDDISEEYYYKKIGNPSLKLKEEIEKAIKKKFNETSDILDDFDWEGKTPEDYFLYVMLKKEFEFEKGF